MKLIVLLSITMLAAGCSILDISEQKTVKIKGSDISVSGKNSTVEIASMPAQLRNAYIWTDELGNRIICSEPFPDVAASTSFNATANALNKLTASLNHSIDIEKQRQANRAASQNSGGNEGSSENSDSGSDFTNNLTNSYSTNNAIDQSINLGLQATSTMVNLGGRTDIVLIASRMMFANCMASANKQLSAPSGKVSPVQENLTKIYDIINDMVKADRAKAQAKQAQAQANQTQAEANKIKAVIKAADKLDPKVLAGIEPSINKQYMETYLTTRDKCIKAASGNAQKIKACNDEYQRKIIALMDI